ncbi:hypothetical protein [Bradyrhizobium sp. CCBAU 051011]|uniref:hypothetical protein n=1 Tax=Bradyrhizobium sp. CCBAU 051011 TaxID=858422 RepID=UPI00137B7F7E|nr:hypothetical protein [Bradyrhizobium sp. CCBAU 051011]
MDTVTRKAVIIGNAGMSDVEAVGGSQGITFQEKLGSGAVQTTTIAKDGSSVHSRHTLIGGKVTPSQYYGSCPYEHRSRDVENSVVAAIPVAIVGGVASHLEAFKEQDRVIKSWTEDTRIWKGLRCGSQFLGKDMTAYTNEFGLIDIGRAGCSDGKFLTRVDEIRDAMNQPAPALSENSYWAIYFPTMGIWLVFALIAFGVVNLLGLWFLAVRSATRWIKAEFQ